MTVGKLTDEHEDLESNEEIRKSTAVAELSDPGMADGVGLVLMEDSSRGSQLLAISNEDEPWDALLDAIDDPRDDDQGENDPGPV